LKERQKRKLKRESQKKKCPRMELLPERRRETKKS
jgi:hypothetical protein